MISSLLESISDLLSREQKC